MSIVMMMAIDDEDVGGDNNADAHL